MDNYTLNKAIDTVKYLLGDDTISDKDKLEAIKNVANMEAFYTITKNDLLRSLRWIFAHLEEMHK